VENDFNLAIDEINLIDDVATAFMLKAKSSCCFKHRWCYRNGSWKKCRCYSITMAARTRRKEILADVLLKSSPRKKITMTFP
jgi:hypothetical protein